MGCNFHGCNFIIMHFIVFVLCVDFGLCFCIFQYFSLETLAIADKCGIFTLLVEWEDSVNVRK